MQILILDGKETETFQAGSGDAPLRALIEARMDTPELDPIAHHGDRHDRRQGKAPVFLL